MLECCNTCKKKHKLVKYIYLDSGEVLHEDEEGFVCSIFGYENVMVHMVGVDTSRGICEEYSPKEETA